MLNNNLFKGEIPVALCKSKEIRGCNLKENLLVLPKQCNVKSWCGIGHGKSGSSQIYVLVGILLDLRFSRDPPRFTF